MGENEQKCGPESHVRCRVDKRESSRNNDGSSEIRQEGEGSEILDRASHLTRNNRCSCCRGHDKTHEQSLRQNRIAGKMKNEDVGKEAEEHLGNKDHPMPTMQAQVKGVYLTEGKEQHKKDEPRQNGFEGQEPSIAEGTDEHREPKGIAVKIFS